MSVGLRRRLCDHHVSSKKSKAVNSKIYVRFCAYIYLNESKDSDPQIFQKPRNHLKNSRRQEVDTRSKFHNEYPQILDVTVQNKVARRPGDRGMCTPASSNARLNYRAAFQSAFS